MDIELPPISGYVICQGCRHSNIYHNLKTGKCEHMEEGWIPRSDCSYPSYPCYCKGWKT